MSPETKPTPETKNVSVSGAIEARFTPEFLKEIKTGQTQEHEREENRYLVEKITLVVVIAYTSLAFWQGCSNQKAAQAARDAANTAQTTLNQSVDRFRQEQRPYIAQTSKTTESPAFHAGQKTPGMGQIIWNWHMSNYGRTPAHDITFTQEMKIAGDDWRRSYGETAPNIGAPLPPASDSFDTVISAPISTQEFQKDLGITGGISIRIKIHYFGLDGTEYDSGLCLSRTNFGSITYCKEDNYIH